jgi:molybdenum cofactor cytidylyltransferase
VIAGIVLAAGRGERVGQPKAWLQTDREGQCFFERACDVLAQGGAEVVVGVVAPDAEPRARRVAPAAILCINAHPEQGQLSSLQVGLRALTDNSTFEAVLVLPVDVPLVSVDTVQTLVRSWRESHAMVVRPTSPDQRHGHPVLFARALFPELLRADLTRGARPIVRAHASPQGDVAVDDEGAFVDIDTAEDYARAFGRLPRQVELR